MNLMVLASYDLKPESFHFDLICWQLSDHVAHPWVTFVLNNLKALTFLVKIKSLQESEDSSSF